MAKQKKPLTPSATRIKAVSHIARLNITQLAKSIGFTTNTQLNQIMIGRNTITPYIASRIVEVYPQLSYQWLLEGQGNMYSIRPTDPLHHKVKALEVDVAEIKQLKGFNTFLERLR